jgi:hypothetical protein
MGRLVTGFAVAMLSLSGTAGLPALTRLMLVQVRAVTRLTRQLSHLYDPPAGPWEFADCASPPGWRLPPVRPTGYLEPRQR